MSIVITSPLDDINPSINGDDTTVNLFNHFDDDLTTGLVASFNLDSSTVTNFNNINNEDSNPDLSVTTNVVLFDQPGQGAPSTVENFLNYVNDGDYVNTIIHRSVPSFIIQGGGFTANGLDTILDDSDRIVGDPNSVIGVISSDDPVDNEVSPTISDPELQTRSNLKGTIAMAKLGGDPDSATNQWFFNLNDNSNNLDNQNGGFTVFGKVFENDLGNLDAIASITTFDARSAFGQGAFLDLPLIVDDPADGRLTGDENFVRYSNITISQQPELTFSVVNNSNPSVVNDIISNNQLVLDALQVGTAEITIQAENLTGDVEIDTFTVTVNDSILDTPFFRFQNTNVQGTYLYASGAEAQDIRDNFPEFVEEGIAFNAAIEPNDELIPFYRFQSNLIPGTYVFVGEGERNNINADPNLASSFSEEGVAFHVYGAGSNEETAFTRFQNSNVLGTYLYASAGEAENIRNNFPGFMDEGTAFEARI